MMYVKERYSSVGGGMSLFCVHLVKMTEKLKVFAKRC